MTYDPNFHPDTGTIERAVYVGSNYPATREVEVTITVNMVRG